MGPGGAERNVANLLPFLVKRYEVHLILMSKVIAYEIPSEVQIHFIENSDPYESGLKKLDRAKQMATTKAVKPVRPPAPIPAADST